MSETREPDYGEPWTLSEHGEIVHRGGHNPSLRTASKTRIIACVNALRGIPDPEVWVKCARGAALEIAQGKDREAALEARVKELEEHAAATERENAELRIRASRAEAEAKKEQRRLIEVCKQLNQEKNLHFDQGCRNLQRAEKVEAQFAQVRPVLSRYILTHGCGLPPDECADCRDARALLSSLPAHEEGQ